MFKYKKEIEQKNDAGLSKTRREQYGQIAKREFSLVADCGLLNMLFSLVLYAAFIGEYMLLTRLQAPTYADRFRILFYGGILATAGFALRAVGRAGNYGVLVKRAFNEGCLVGAQFMRSIRENGGTAALFGMLTGISHMVMTCGSLHFLYNSDSAISKGLGVGICIFQFMLVFAASEYTYCEQQVYVLPKSGYFRNGFLFSLMGFLPTLCWFALDILVPFVLCLLPLPVPVFVLLIWGTLLNAFLQVAACLFMLDRFDRYINSENYPDRVGRGLAKEENNQETVE